MTATTKSAAAAAAIVTLLGLSAALSPARAQIDLGGGWTLEGNAEIGGRAFIDKPAESRRAKWEEYRDFPGGVFLPDLQLRVFRNDEKYWAEIAGSKWGQQDQEFSLRGGQLGLFDVGFDWDQIPHVYSTNARFLATETSRGVFALPSTRPPLVRHNSAPDLEISQRWDTSRVFFDITPTPDLAFKAEYTRIRKQGDRPFGMAFGSPGNNFYEILEPIDQTIHDFRIGGTWARDMWQLQFGYVLSVFDNDLRAVRADNPCFGTTAPAGCGTDNNGAPATGQTSLAPSNMAHTWTLNGGVNLPWWRTRLTGNFSYSLQFQNEDFLPHTINPAFAGNPDLVLPQGDLNGRVQTILGNVGLVTRPIQNVTITAKYRIFDYADRTDEIEFPALVVNDRTLAEGRRVPRFDYQKQNADIDARWQIVRPLALTLGGGWEHWSRPNHREVPKSDEPYAKAAVDFTPLNWLLARITYRPSFRRISEYNTGAHAAHAVLDVEELTPAVVSTGQSVLTRKFDEAERNRQRIDVLLQLTPLDNLTISPTGSWIFDDYLSKPPVDPSGTGRHDFLGVQEQVGWNAGIDMSWTPMERVSLSLGYMHESNFRKMDSRSRTVISNFGVDFSDFDWISNITDTVDTLYAGAKFALIPRVLDLGFNGSWSYALGRVENRNPTAPVSSTPAAQFTATAKPMPAFEDELIRLEAALSYHFLKSWTATFGYVFESFQKNDWRTDQLNPFVPTAGSSIWLGNDLRNYTAHILVATLGYRF